MAELIRCMGTNGTLNMFTPFFFGNVVLRVISFIQIKAIGYKLEKSMKVALSIFFYPFLSVYSPVSLVALGNPKSRSSQAERGTSETLSEGADDMFDLHFFKDNILLSVCSRIEVVLLCIWLNV